MNPHDHPLFKQYPLAGTAVISTGAVPTPYHIYDGFGLFIGGVCDGPRARALLADQQLEPLCNADGKAIMGIWICNFTDASLGPHHELQISFFASNQPAAPPLPHPFAAPLCMLDHPRVRMLCYGLWNNTPGVVAYNREVLSLNARLAESQITQTGPAVSFSFQEPSSQQVILSGALPNAGKPSFTANRAFLAAYGLRRTLALARQPWISLEVLNPLGARLDRHAPARTFTKNARSSLRLFDPQHDTLSFGPGPFRDLGFEAHCVQWMDGFKFVYLNPEP